MTPTTFKFKYNGLARQSKFENVPNWLELTNKVKHLFRLPFEKIAVTFTDEDEDEMGITSEEELQDFYQSSFGRGGTIKLNVRDLSLFQGDYPSSAETPERPAKKRVRLEEPHTPIKIQAELPSLPDSPTSRKRLSEQTESSYASVSEKWKLKRLAKPLPSLEELAGFINTPLEPSEKIPITQSMFENLISSRHPDICSQDDVESVFRVVPNPDANFTLFYHTASSNPPPPGTEYAYVHFWDSNIRDILERLLPAAQVLRNSNHHLSTANLRPDLALLLEALCVWRGEEKPHVKDDPKKELRDKLLWVYDDAPYLLGYTCEGCIMTVVAITAPSASAGGKPDIKDLVRIDLSSTKERIRNIRNMINIAYILPKLAALVRSGVQDFAFLTRTNSDVEVTSTVIIKTYKCVDAETKIRHLKRVYSLLTAHLVPNTDELIIGQGKTVRLCPRGIDTQPEVQRELRECLLCILNSLVTAHAIPLFHRDIRWPNVMRSIKDGSKWFLIDWEDAATPPTTAQSSLSREMHSPDVFRDGHGAEVDIWGIGYLIKSCEALDISLDLRALGVRICNESRQLTAQQVIELVKACA